ncbi:hypothetical protein QM012_005341 [Aureobasidium pullulans]|uniref:Transcription factor domain-containing protein n=1 Tax=Aureobasidium pullulans TaxID=5580 RepID=A0ABR0T4T3_AURPU
MSQQRTSGPPPRQGMLNIITFGEPQESTSVRAIRSHAAKAGWKSRKNSRTRAAAAQNSLPGPGAAEPAPATARLAPPPLPHKTLPAVPSWLEHDTARKIVPPLQSSNLPSPPSSNSSDSPPSSTHSPHDTVMASTIDDSGYARFETNNHDEEDLDHDNTHALELMTKEPTASRFTSIAHPSQFGSTHDPFSQFPVRWEEAFGPLIHFYRKCLGEAWMGLISADWGQQGNIEFVDFALEISISQREPAMFYGVLSNTSVMAPASNSLSMRQQPYMSQWLRHKAVESLRAAIMDPKRAYTDAIILAVNHVFFNEALRSERHTALNVHGAALKKMVDKRGGLSVIAANGRQGLILSRYLSWCDRIVASTFDSEPLFGNYVEDLSVGRTQWDGMWSKVQTMI